MEGSESVVEPTTPDASASAVETPAAAEPQTPAVDLSAFEERMVEVAGGIGTLNERFERFESAQQPDEDEWDEDAATPEQRAERFINEKVAARVEAILGEKLAPIEQRVSHGERLSAINDLEVQYPNLRGEEAEKVMQAAEGLAKRGVFADALHPEAIELAYLAEIGRGAVAQEKPAGQSQATPLEGAGAEAPTQQEPHPGDAIVAANETPDWVLRG